MEKMCNINTIPGTGSRNFLLRVSKAVQIYKYNIYKGKFSKIYIYFRFRGKNYQATI
jgi:hypothetical protein